MAHHPDARAVDAGLRLDPVHHAARAPRPGRDRAPGVRLAHGGIGLEHRVHAVGEAVVDIGVDVAVMERQRRIAARDQLLGREEGILFQAVGIDMFGGRAVADQHEGRRGPHGLGDEGGQGDRAFAARAAVADADTLAQRPPLHHLAVRLDRLKAQRRGPFDGIAAEDVRLEEFQHFGPAHLLPRLDGGDRLPGNRFEYVRSPGLQYAGGQRCGRGRPRSRLSRADGGRRRQYGHSNDLLHVSRPSSTNHNLNLNLNPNPNPNPLKSGED